MTAAPSVEFVLPGRWTKAALDDPAGVAALSDLLPSQHHGLGAWWESLRAAGADTLLVRPSSDPPTAIVFVWPTSVPQVQPSSAAALSAVLGTAGDPVPHDEDYPVLRSRRTGDTPPRDVVTYALSHPTSGRVLLVRCMSLDGPFQDFMLRDFDLAAAALRWDEA